MNKILSAATRLATISATAKLPSWLLGMSPAHQKAYLKEHPDSPFANLMGGAKVAPATKSGAPSFAEYEEMAAKILDLAHIRIKPQNLHEEFDMGDASEEAAKIDKALMIILGRKTYDFYQGKARVLPALLYKLGMRTETKVGGVDVTKNLDGAELFRKDLPPSNVETVSIPVTYKVPKDSSQPYKINGDLGKGARFAAAVAELGFGTVTKPLTKPVLDRLLLKANTILDVKTKSNGKIVTACYIINIGGKWYWLDTSVEGVYYMIKRGAKVDDLVAALGL